LTKHFKEALRRHGLPKICIAIGNLLLNLFARIIGKTIRYSRRVKLPSFYEARQTLERYHSVPESSTSSLKMSKNILYDVTIIVPCYNVEQYIQQCIDSLKSLSFREKLEVILVNDGSTDGTLSIIESNKFPDSWTLINQSNSGLAAARNKGIAASHGQYLTFVDSDDIIDSEGLQTLWMAARENDLDLVDGSIVRLENPNQYLYRYKKYVANVKNEPVPISVSGMAMGRLYRRDLWKNVRFPESFWYEDTAILYLIFPRVVRYGTIPDVTYHYRYNPNGQSKSVKNSRVIDTVYIIPKLLKLASDMGVDLGRVRTLTLWQESRFVYERVSPLGDDSLLQAAFVCAMESYRAYYSTCPGDQDSKLLRMICTSFLSKDYELWRFSSRILLLKDQLRRLSVS